MKRVVISMVLFSTLSAQATPSVGIICRDDRRVSNGPLRELILTPKADGYLLQSQFVPSLDSPDITIENWADKLSCRIDEKAPIAFCTNPNGHSVALIKERREVFYDSLEEDAKKKTNKYIDISLNENDVETKTNSFAASHCQLFGEEA